jgi:hypothetical protein
MSAESERLKKRWGDPGYRARMLLVLKRNAKRISKNTRVAVESVA